MLKCSPEAYARCPTREYCGDPNDATFTEGSECDRFNQMVNHSPRTNNNGPQEKVECETCLHREVCDQSSRQMWSAMAGEKQCADFKDSSRFVELPCKIGDHLYEVITYKGGKPSHIIKSVVRGLHITDEYPLHGHKRKNYIVAWFATSNSVKHYLVDQIGKTVFLSLQEAQNAISDRGE